MRIFALITDAFRGRGGIARYNQNFLLALASSNSKVTRIVLPRLSEEKSTEKKLSRPAPRIIQKPSPPSKFMYVLAAIQTLWKNGPFDLIFCGHLHLAPLSAVLAKGAKVPLWLQLYGIEAWEKPSFLIRWAVKQASLVTAVSRYTRRRFLTWAEIDPEKVRVLPNAMDERFHPGPKPEYLLKRYGLAGKKILLTLCRLTERYKGQDRVIRILPQLLQKHPNLVYVIAGEGEDRLRLEALARGQGLDGTVQFIGEVNEPELVDHYQMADLFVMPSTGEGFGIVFLEAGSCGIPVVGGNEDGSVDALLEGQMGRMVKPDDPDELLHAILEGLDSKAMDPEKLERFSNSNFCNWVQQLTQCL